MHIRPALKRFALASLVTLSAQASQSDLIGSPRSVLPREDETLLDVARRFNIGQDELMLANQQADRWLPDIHQPVILPTQHILPDAPRNGLVLNLPEMRLYQFVDSPTANDQQVFSYAVSIGRINWKTPPGRTEVVMKRQNPTWTPPQSIRLEAAARGTILPPVMAAGPANPLGAYALNLAQPGYLIHGTNRELGIGMRVTHGCIRMYPEDIEAVFESVSIGTAVYIVNEPVKFGWHEDKLYMEVHPPLEESNLSNGQLLEIAVTKLHDQLALKSTRINSSLLRRTVNAQTGLPVLLSNP